MTGLANFFKKIAKVLSKNAAKISILGVCALCVAVGCIAVGLNAGLSSGENEYRPTLSDNTSESTGGALIRL